MPRKPTSRRTRFRHTYISIKHNINLDFEGFCSYLYSIYRNKHKKPLTIDVWLSGRYIGKDIPHIDKELKALETEYGN